MSHSRPSDQGDLSEPVNHLVLRALAALAPTSEGAQPRAPLAHYLKSLKEAALAPSPEGLEEVIAQLQRMGLGTGQILETYVAGAARQLGADWVDFGAVTIGASRLQGVARRLDRELSGTLPSVRVPGLLVAIPAGEQHILGGAILATLLRERGLGARLLTGATQGNLAAELAGARCAGVFLTASGHQQVENLKGLVECIRCESRRTPVLVGGPILEQVEHMAERIGADLATSDIDAALSLCATFDAVLSPAGA